MFASKTASIKPQTPQMASLLEVGYGMTLVQAKTIVKERKENPALWPFEQLQKAEAFLAAYNGVPLADQVISKRTGPERSQSQAVE